MREPSFRIFYCLLGGEYSVCMAYRYSHAEGIREGVVSEFVIRLIKLNRHPSLTQRSRSKTLRAFRQQLSELIASYQLSFVRQLFALPC